jgi:serine/threonine protein kinase
MIDIVSLFAELSSLNTLEQQQRLQPLKIQFPEQVNELEKMLAINHTPVSSSELIESQMSNVVDLSYESLIGQIVMGFTVTKLVSEAGGMGLVFEGEQRLICTDSHKGEAHKAAIKILRANKFSSTQQRAIFFNEATTLMSLDHPNVCSIYGVSEVLGSACIVMDFIDGQGLDIWLASSKKNLKQKLNIFEQLLGAVSYLHRKHLYHGDLKPQNIIINDQGHLVLIDLGLTRKYKRNMNDPFVSAYTIKAFTRFWSAPEQIAGEVPSAQSDVYSLGVLLHYVLTGTTVLPGHQLGGKYSELNAIINKALSNNPEFRFPDALAFEQSIHRFKAGLPVVEYSQSTYYLFQKLLKRKPFTSLACMLFVYSFATTVWIFTH